MSHAADASDLAKFHACCSAGSLHLDHNRRGTVGSAAVSEAEPLTVFPDAAEAAEAMLREDPDTNMRIRRVLGLTKVSTPRTGWNSSPRSTGSPSTSIQQMPPTSWPNCAVGRTVRPGCSPPTTFTPRWTRYVTEGG